jgi:DNA-binding MarR family transcriptional regulator
MNTQTTDDDVAGELIEVVPQVMQTLRSEFRRQRGPDLSVVQFRVLAYLNRHPGAALSAVADHVGLTLPSMSSQVTGLVGRELVNRSTSREDRRYVTLTLTPKGNAMLGAAIEGARANLAVQLKRLSPEERRTILQALALLRRVFAPPPHVP